MRNSNVTKVIELQEVRDDLVKLEQEIVRVMNERGWEGIGWIDKVSVAWGDLDYWHCELRRILSSFV